MFSKQPLVSVLLPFYKPGKWFSTAIDSIINQTYTNWELVLVDNNDEQHYSSKLAEQYAIKNDQLHIIIEKERGIANALNTGLANCSGKFISRMDADDFSEPDRVRLQVEFLEEHEHIGVVSGIITYDSEVENQGMKSYVDQLNSIWQEHEIFELRFVESPFAHPSVMIRSELFRKFGAYSKEPGIPEDYELWLR